MRRGPLRVVADIAAQLEPAGDLLWRFTLDAAADGKYGGLARTRSNRSSAASARASLKSAWRTSYRPSNPNPNNHKSQIANHK
jgi:hypothetical protein